ncbi:MAG: hypothetical protein WCE68_07230 [Anaerolineales bacterium]
MKSQPRHNQIRRVRPAGIFFLVLFVLALVAWNGLRLGEALYFWKTLEKYGANPLYICFSAGVWLYASLFLVWGLWHGKAWGWAATLAGTIGYTAWYWLDRLALQKPHANWPFVLIINIIILLIIFPILFVTRTRQFFQRDGNERKPETPKPA